MQGTKDGTSAQVISAPIMQFTVETAGWTNEKRKPDSKIAKGYHYLRFLKILHYMLDRSVFKIQVLTIVDMCKMCPHITISRDFNLYK